MRTLIALFLLACSQRPETLVQRSVDIGTNDQPHVPEAAPRDCGVSCRGHLPDSQCAAFNPALYSGGEARCTSECMLDVGACVFRPPAAPVAPVADDEAACSADCNGALPSTQCGLLNPRYGGGAASCTADCQLDLSGCTLVSGRFEECTGEGQGSCVAGLLCLDTGVGRLCTESCDPAAPEDSCLVNAGFCHRAGICLPQDAGRCLDDAYCFGGLRCIHMEDLGDQDYLGVCGILCPAEEVMRSGASCPQGQTCLPQGVHVQVRLTSFSGHWPPTEDSCHVHADCDTQEDWACLSVEMSGAGGKHCARFNGICGYQIDPIASLSDLSADADSCDLETTGNHHFCGTTDPGHPPAQMMCVRPASLAGEAVCIALCDPGSTGPLKCGASYHCGMPDEPFVFRYQRGASGGDGNERVLCAEEGNDAPCNQGEGFTCRSIQGQLTCAKPAALCIPD